MARPGFINPDAIALGIPEFSASFVHDPVIFLRCDAGFTGLYNNDALFGKGCRIYKKFSFKKLFPKTA
jgi:hypothetical protein